MSRVGLLVLAAGLVAGLLFSAFGSSAQAGDKAKLKLCLALDKCRGTYTYCFNRIEKHVPPAKWSEARDKCVATYKVCINKHFKGGELFFTRWFVPDAKCDQYR